MRNNTVGLMNAVVRIVLGTMLFMLLWFHTLNYIIVSESKQVMLIILIIGLYLLLTGSARICPICYLIDEMKK